MKNLVIVDKLCAFPNQSNFPPHFRRYGGGTATPLRSSPFGTCSSSPLCGEAVKKIPPPSAAEVHGANGIFPEFLSWENLKNFLPKLGEEPNFFYAYGISVEIFFTKTLLKFFTTESRVFTLLFAISKKHPKNPHRSQVHYPPNPVFSLI
ncbi:MAG: hypothetical protein WC295_10250 [Methanoregula sp.]